MHRGQTNRVRLLTLTFKCWPWPLTLTFNPRKATVMAHAYAKGQGQRSLGSIVRVETDGRRRLHCLPCQRGWEKNVRSPEFESWSVQQCGGGDSNRISPFLTTDRGALWYMCSHRKARGIWTAYKYIGWRRQTRATTPHAQSTIALYKKTECDQQ